MKRLKLVIVALWLSIPLLAFAGSAPTTAPDINSQPTTVKENLCTGSGGKIVGGKCVVPGKELTGDKSLVINVTNTLTIVAGAVAVIIIIVSGIRYITSTGDAMRVKQSKDTLLYAVLGLIVVTLAYAIVHFVSTNVG